MKRLLSAIFALTMLTVCALSLFSCEEADVDAPSGMVLASSESAGYLFYVPESWICDVSSGATTAYYSSSDASNVSVMSFSAEHTDYTVEDWWDSFKTDFESIYSDFEIVSSENTVLDGNAAMKFTFKGTLEERTYSFMQVVTVRNVALSAPQIYVFTYTSVPDYYDSHIEDVQQMLDNFSFN